MNENHLILPHPVAMMTSGSARPSTPVITPALRNGGFETAGTAGQPFASWTKYNSGTSSVNDETSVVYAGSHSCRFDLDATPSAVGVFQTGVLTVGGIYVVTFWGQATGTGKVRVETDLSTLWTSATFAATWAQYVSPPLTADNANFYLSRGVGSTGGSKIYIDNVTVTRVA